MTRDQTVHDVCTLALLSVCVAAVGAAAAESKAGASTAPALRIEALIEEAQARNPEVQAAEQRVEAARAVIPQVQTLPDPAVSLSYQDLVERETMYGVSQEIPFPGKLRLRGSVATRESERAEQEYVAVRFNVVARLKEAYYELYLVHRSQEILANTKALLVAFEDSAETRYAVGQGAQQDVFRAQVEISRVLARIAGLEQRKQSLHAEINRLLNRPPVDPLGAPGDVTLTPLRHSLAELTDLAGTAAPLLRAQLKGVERGADAVALARRDYYPDFEVSALGVHSEPMDEDGYQLMLNVRVPLYYATKQRQAVREAVAGREQAVADLATLRQDVFARVKDNHAQIGRAEEVFHLLDQAIIPQARLTLAAAQAGYGTGAVDFLTLLNGLLTLQESEIERHTEIAEHERAVARIEELIGAPP